MEIAVSMTEDRPRDVVGEQRTELTRSVSVDDLHREPIRDPTLDEPGDEGKLLLEVVDDAAVRLELEVVDLLRKLRVQLAREVRELELRTSRPGDHRHVAGVSPG